VVERGQNFGLAFKVGEALAVMRDGGGRDFDGHLGIRLGLLGAVLLDHAVRADGRENLVRTEAGSGSQRHGV